MFKTAILTVSDKGSQGQREDVSGDVIRDLVAAKGWEIVCRGIVPDEKEVIEAELVRMADEEGAVLILTTGGTGFSPRDVTPEATLAVIDRPCPGIPEAMRAFSMTKTKRAMLSRAAAGIRQRTLIVNLPGSPRAVAECLGHVIDELQHGLEILCGRTGECATKPEESPKAR